LARGTDGGQDRDGGTQRQAFFHGYSLKTVSQLVQLLR
jgi:hypothetical protein